MNLSLRTCYTLIFISLAVLWQDTGDFPMRSPISLHLILSCSATKAFNCSLYTQSDHLTMSVGSFLHRPQWKAQLKPWSWDNWLAKCLYCGRGSTLQSPCETSVNGLEDRITPNFSFPSLWGRQWLLLLPGCIWAWLVLWRNTAKWKRVYSGQRLLLGFI